MSDSEKKKRPKIEKITLNVVPKDKRKSWLDVSLIQAGVYICVPSLLLGGMLVQCMSLSDTIITLGLGYLVSIVITALIGIIGEDLGVPTCVIGMASFGKLGARVVISSIFAIALIGWFSAQNAVCGSAFANFLAQMGFDVPLTACTAFWGIVMLATAVYGIDGLKILNYIAVPALAIIFIIGTKMAINEYGVDALSAPIAPTMNIFEGVVLCGSFLSVGMTNASDFTRYQKSRGGVWASSILGIWVPGFILGILGAVLTKLTEENDLSLILADIGLPILGAAILILATWTTNTTNIYSSGINLVMLLKLKDDKRALATVVSGIGGTIIAMTGFATFFELFVNTLGILFFPVGGVFLADYLIIRGNKPENFRYSSTVNWAGVIAWCAGCVLTMLTPAWGLFAGFFLSAVLYIIIYKVLPCKEVNVIDPLKPINPAE